MLKKNTAEPVETESAPPAAGPPLSPHLSGGLTQLLRAFDYAAETGRTVWDFAVEIGELRGSGMTTNDFRWLIARGFAQHGRETTIYGDPQRSFRPGEGLTFVKTTAFVLTPQGAAFLRDGREAAGAVRPPPSALIPAGASVEGSPPSPKSATACPPSTKPEWDARSRELRWNGLLVKKFRVPAENQACVLSAFQEESWPAYIDDPLPKISGIAPKRRLSCVIRRLNHGQVHPRIRFHGNGSGEGVGWIVLEPGAPAGPGEAVQVAWQPGARKRRRRPAAESRLAATAN